MLNDTAQLSSENLMMKMTIMTIICTNFVMNKMTKMLSTKAASEHLANQRYICSRNDTYNK